MGMFEDASIVILDALSPTYRMLDQDIGFGLAWASAVFPDSANFNGLTIDTSVFRGDYFLAPTTKAFSVLRFFLTRHNGTMPTADETVYFDSNGDECESTDAFVFYMAVRIVGGKAWFSANFSGSTLETDNGYYRTAQAEAGYTGAALDVQHLTDDDYTFSEFHFFKIQTANLPDLTNLNANSGGAGYYNITDTFVAFMNGIMKGKINNTNRVTFQNMVYPGSVDCTTLYDPGIPYCSPDFGHPAEIESYYSLSYSSETLLSYYKPLSIIGAALSPLENFEQDTADEGEGGFSGNFNPYSDAIGFSDLPNLGFTDTGFARLYTGLTTQVRALAQYMWNDSGFETAFKRWLYGDNGGALNSIINFGIIPLDLSGYWGTLENVTIGNVPTNIPLYPLTAEYISYDLGYIDLRERWGTALDYEPTTMIELFLPFVGFVQVQTSDFMRPKSYGESCTIRLRYNINLFTGDFMAELVGFTRESPHANILLAQHAGNMLIKCPTSAGDYSAFYKNIIGAGAQIVGNALGGLGGAAGAATGVVTGAISSACAIQPVQRSGNIASAASVLGSMVPYIVIHQPEQWLSDKYGQYEGFPSLMSAKLGNLKGYTEIEAIELDQIPALQEELNEIERLLKEGVYL